MLLYCFLATLELHTMFRFLHECVHKNSEYSLDLYFQHNFMFHFFDKILNLKLTIKRFYFLLHFLYIF